MKQIPIPTFNINTGITIEADYQDPLLEEYRNNPLLEALPPIWDDSTVIQNLASKPLYKVSERELPVHLRMHCVQRVSRDFFQPLSKHLELEQSLSRLIRDGYVGRNPLTPNYAFRTRKDTYDLMVKGLTDAYPINTPTSSGFAMVGISGIGKSSTLLRILKMYPQVIVHHEYQGNRLPLYQIVWLKLDCPHDGSIRSLCLNFLLAVDSLVGTKYYNHNSSKYTDELLPIMAQAAAVHCLGVLVIDEIQNLEEAKDDRAPQMLNFFVQLVNTIGLPVVVVGTYKALPVLNGEFRNARRGSGQGDSLWEHMKKDEEWVWLLKGLWKYQWTDEKVELTDEFVDVMYEESQGITDIAIKLFMLAQWRALDQKRKTISTELIRSVAKDRLTLVRDALAALRSGKKREIQKYADLYAGVSIDDYLNRIEEQQRQANRLEVIRQELGYDVKEQETRQLSSWLVEVGYEKEIASKAAEEVISNNLSSLDEMDIQKEGAKAALRIKHECMKDSSDTTRRMETKKKLEPTDSDDLRVIIFQGRSRKLSAYEALRKSQYIKNAKEFLS
ncbi:ATP-binding protein [Paenibacillus chondroitinus]|uniref:ATP-binding protein n=1 Tax=Paenibacillus chondroitinus TaxID=59842 RepID=A0ABU6D491_9BACL|nr:MULTISPECIES: ATP-binding protein [Paenibacillus]MCY9661296.1 ATP-binding protein [Paenibacillus anseongense]MEB4792550.1 ATP-binding protein [Paenibacillus chondroitinus]